MTTYNRFLLSLIVEYADFVCKAERRVRYGKRAGHNWGHQKADDVYMADIPTGRNAIDKTAGTNM